MTNPEKHIPTCIQTGINPGLAQLNHLASVLDASPDLPTLLQRIENHLSKDLGFPAGSVYLPGSYPDTLQVAAAWGLPEPSRDPFPLSAYHCPRILQEKTVALSGGPDAAQILSIPLIAQAKIQGVLDLFFYPPERPAPQDLSYFQALGHLIGLALHNSQLHQAELQARQTAEGMRQASLALTQSLNLDAVLKTLQNYLERLVGFDSAFINLFETGGRFRMQSASGKQNSYPHHLFPLTTDPQDHTILKALLEKRISQRRCDTSPASHRDNQSDCEEVSCWLFLPLVVGDQVIGFCLLGKDESHCYTDEQLRLADALVSQAVVSIQNAWLFQQIREGHAQTQSLSRRLVEIQEIERTCLARELHDEAGQALASIMLYLDLLSNISDKPQAVRAGIQELENAVQELMKYLHGMAVSLRPASLDHLGLAPGIRQYVEEFGRKHEILAQFEHLGLESPLASELENAIFRITQEALTNVVRHARATRVDVLLNHSADRLILVIEDNGIGFDPLKRLEPGHLGLVGMHERVDMLGGELLIESKPNKGATIRVEVPLRLEYLLPI